MYRQQEQLRERKHLGDKKQLKLIKDNEMR